MSKDDSNDTEIDKARDDHDEGKGVHDVVVVVEAFADEDQIEDSDQYGDDNTVGNNYLFPKISLHLHL